MRVDWQSVPDDEIETHQFAGGKCAIVGPYGWLETADPVDLEGWA